MQREAWNQFCPPLSARSKLIKYFAVNGPDYPYHIASAASGRSYYSTVHDTIRDLASEGFVRELRVEPGEKGLNRLVYGLTDVKGFILAMACAGTKLEFPTLFYHQRKIVASENLPFLEMMKAVWEECGSFFTTRVSRQCLLAYSETEDEEGSDIALINLFVNFLLDRTPWSKARKLVKRSEPLQRIVWEVHRETGQLLRGAGLRCPCASQRARVALVQGQQA